MEIEDEWAKEKAHKQATSTMAAPPRRSHRKAWIVAAIVIVVAGVIAAGVIVQLRTKQTEYTPSVPRPEGMIGIQIRSNPQAMIRIDGNKAGKTPLTLHMRKATQQVRIEAVIDGKTQTKLVVPDRDQDVGFTR